MLREFSPPRRRQLRGRLLLAALSLLLAACASEPGPPAPGPAAARAERVVGEPGGRLVVALRAEPRTLNPVLAYDRPSVTVIRRTMADLIHINRHTQLTEAALAESWTASPDGRAYTLRLRRGVSFSDGQPFDADDVLFTFEVYLDPEIGAPNRDMLMVGGSPLEVRKVDSHTLEFEFAEPYAVGDRLFDSIAILPEHRLGAAYREGRFATAWGREAAPAEFAGLGPFRLREYRPGERLVLERNPHYWKLDEAGQRLPYVDELVFLFVPSTDAQTIRFQSGETDLIDLMSAENFALLERQRESRGYLLQDLGPGLTYHFLFFNLNSIAGGNLDSIAAKQGWFGRVGFRRAVSAAVDREAIARLVYQGRATPLGGPVTGGDRLWRNEEIDPPERSLERARELLRAEGFSWDPSGALIDERNRAVSFTIATNSSNTQRVQMATIIQEDLGQLGIGIQVVPLEFRALVDRLLNSFEYEACILGLTTGDADPNPSMNVWLSSGGSHFWRPGQEQPATAWEAEVDRLMRAQLSELDRAERKRIFDRVQVILADQQPFIFLVSPNVLVGAKRGLGNFRPAILDHPTLWNAEELFWER